MSSAVVSSSSSSHKSAVVLCCADLIWLAHALEFVDVEVDQFVIPAMWRVETPAIHDDASPEEGSSGRVGTGSGAAMMGSLHTDRRSRLRLKSG